MWTYMKAVQVWICGFLKFIVIKIKMCNFWEYKPAGMGNWPQKKGREDLPDLLRLDNSLNNAKKKKRYHRKLRLIAVSRHTGKLIVGKNMTTIHESQEKNRFLPSWLMLHQGTSDSAVPKHLYWGPFTQTCSSQSTKLRYSHPFPNMDKTCIDKQTNKQKS